MHGAAELGRVDVLPAGLVEADMAEPTRRPPFGRARKEAQNAAVC